MREAVGGSVLLYIVVIISSIIMFVFVGFFSYTKAYKVKNRIIQIVEKYEVYEKNEDGNNPTVDEINQNLATLGYNTASPRNCNSIKDRLSMGNEKYKGRLSDNENENGYNYCIYKVNYEGVGDDGNNPYHYVVVTFVHFQLPIIGDALTIPVYGETKILGKDYSYE